MEDNYGYLVDVMQRYSRAGEKKRNTANLEKKFYDKKNEVLEKISSYDKMHRRQFKLLFDEFDILVERKKLFEDKEHDIESGEKKMGNDEMLHSATVTSKQTTVALKQSLQKLTECEEIGNSALATIDLDKAKLEKVNANLDTIESDSKIAQKLLTRFVKRLYTDKLILCFVVIVVLLIVVIVLMKCDIINT
jgi:hypothetical protein